MLDVLVKDEYSELFGVKVVNGRRVVVEELIEKITRAVRPDISRALNSRRMWLEDKRPLAEKGAFPSWDRVFRDADGDSKNFREIVQGLIDNFLDRDTPLRWRLNEHVPVPKEAHPLKNAGLEITGPWYPLSRAINQINADVVTAFEDEEDASPAWFVPRGSGRRHAAVWDARMNVKRVLAGEVPDEYREGGKTYRITKPRDRWPAVFHRLPGIHLLDFDVLLDGEPVPAIVTSAVIYVLNNFESLRRAGRGVYFYVPKIQTPEEALIVERILRMIEGELGLACGSIKIAMLYEEGVAGLYLPAILWVWRSRLIKSSNGRWDYLGSLIEMWKDEAIFPDPQTITMSSPNMVLYQRYNALMMLMAGLKDGEPEAAPVGGMAAVMLYPTTDPYGRHRYNPKALRDIRLDKLRERLLGLIFVTDEPVGGKVRLSDVLAGRVRGRLYDLFRQSWVATKDEAYIAAGTELLKADISQLQRLIKAEVRYVEVEGRLYPTVDSGLTGEEMKRFTRLGVLDSEGDIALWVIPATEVDSPEKLFTSKIWGEKGLWHGLYDVPQGEITPEHIQHAFYMAANYGFQVLNGNLAAAIDDYELGQRFMNDLATYRIFVSWLWTIIKHGAAVTRDGYLRGPSLTELGVTPSVDRVRIARGERFREETFKRLWELHNEWVREFYRDYDRIVASRIVSRIAGEGAVSGELVERVSRILSHTYAAGPFRSLSPREAATAVAELLNTSPSQVEGEITAGAPRFDRSEAAVTMEMLLKQLTSPRYIQHSARLLFVLAGLEDSERSMVMEAVFSPSRDWVVDQVRRAVLPSKALRIHDYVYDYWGV
jgi:malate synthase